MKITRIPKKNGSFRTIYMPDPKEKAIARTYLQRLLHINVAGMEVQHGFTQGRSPVTNALEHVGWQYTLCMDLKDFFDTVTFERFRDAVYEIGAPDGVPSVEWLLLTEGDGKILREAAIFPDGAARQGVPSSPTIANIAATPMDRKIIAMRKRGRFRNFTYTRYADDMAFSFDRPGAGKMLLKRIPEIVAESGFVLNPKKTRLQWAGAGRRMITGVAVDDQIHIPRRVRRRIRAGMHHIRKKSIGQRTLRSIYHRRAVLKEMDKHPGIWAVHFAMLAGLVEWSKMRVPKHAGRRTTRQYEEATEMVRRSQEQTDVLMAEMTRFKRKIGL